MKAVPAVLRQNTYLFLTLGLLLNFALLALPASPLRNSFVLAVYVYILVASTFAMLQTRRFLREMLVFLTLILLLTGADIFGPVGGLSARVDAGVATFAAASTLVFLLIVMVRILFDVLTARDPDSDKVWGAVTVYLLWGVAWALLYSIIEHDAPGSFDLGEVTPQTTSALFPYRPLFVEFFYFSHVTLSTLGYGDITPVSRLARMLSALEAISGQIFLAVLVAWLVARHVTHPERARLREPEADGPQAAG